MRIALLWALLVLGVLQAAEPVGWARDRSGSFPEANPPFTFDGVTGENIAWRTQMPNWSNGGLIVDDGKVFTMAEPTDSYRPSLTCLDAASGEIRWQHELDAVACFPRGEQAEVRRFAEETWAWRRRLESLWSEAYVLHRQHGSFKDWDTPPAAIAERWAAIGAEVKQLGAEWNKNAFRSRAGGVSAPFGLPRKGEGEQRIGRLADLCLTWDLAWRGFGTWCGIAFPTPVSHDGRVYTMTAHNHYACFTHEGDVVWQRRFLRPSDRTVEPVHRDRIPAKRWRPSWPGQACFPSSPVLAEGVLMSSTGYYLRGLDAATGEQLWAKPYPKHLGQGMATPAVVRVDGVALLIAVGHETGRGIEVPPGDEIVRVRDGRTVGRLPGTASGKGPGTGPIVVGNDLVVTRRYVDKRTRAMNAFRLRWEAKPDRLVCEPVWSHDKDTKLPRGLDLFRRAPWHDGLAYAGTTVFDLRSGQAVKDHGRAWRVNQGYTGQGGCVIGPAYCRWNFYGDEKVPRGVKLRGGDASFHFFDRRSGKPLGIGKLPVHPADGLPPERQQAEEHRHQGWRWLGAGTPFAVGKRLYIRSYDFVWCTGR